MAEELKNTPGDEMNIEEMFSKIEEKLAMLGRNDISLEESLMAYEEGIHYINACHEAINSVEKKVMVIRENGKLENFES